MSQAAQRAIIHLDMDAFYASVEQRDRPELRGQPVIVGGHRWRGVVLAASYEVRPFGVRSAMPMAEAMRRAPQAIVVPPRPEAYASASDEVFAILESVTPLVEPLSLDEAFLDVTASQSLFGRPAEIAAALRARISRELDLPSSAGIAAVKFVAKIASDLAKPAGQQEVPAAGTRAFLAALPIGRLWGVGRKTEAAFHALGIRTMGDLAARDAEWVERTVPGGAGLWELCQGIDPRPVIPDLEAKSLGSEDTFEADLRGRQALHPFIHAQALRVGRRLRRARVKARVVQLKLKLADFTLVTRRTTLPEPCDDGQMFYRTALALLGAYDLRAAVRLTGVSAQELVRPGPQLSLYSPAPSRTERLNAALDLIAQKFGGQAVLPADVAAVREEDDEEGKGASAVMKIRVAERAAARQRGGRDDGEGT
jgi:DNA polymerase-4